MIAKSNLNSSPFIKSLALFTFRLAKIAGLLTPLNFALDASIDVDDPPATHAIQARAVREISKKRGLNCFPIILSERQTCSDCGRYTMVHVQPDNTCVHCWGRTLGIGFRFHK